MPFENPPLLFDNCLQLAGCQTAAALDALAVIDLPGGELIGGSDVIGLINCTHRTSLGAAATADTLVQNDGVVNQVLADLGRTGLVHDVGKVLVPEVVQRGHDGVGCGLAQSAQGVGLNGSAQLFQLFQILHGAVALGDPGQDLQHTLGADAAGRALAAGFVADESRISEPPTENAYSFA